MYYYFGGILKLKKNNDDINYINFIYTLNKFCFFFSSKVLDRFETLSKHNN